MKVELQKIPDQVWSTLYHRFCETMEMSNLEWQKVFCRTCGEGLSRLRLNKNSIVPIRINDFGHENDNVDRELYERSDTICQKNEVFSYRVWRPWLTALTLIL